MTASCRQVSPHFLVRISLALILVLSALQIQSQSKLITHRLLLKADTTLVENTTIVPESVVITASSGHQWQYALDNQEISISRPQNVLNQPDSTSYKLDTLVMSYRLLAENLGESTSIMDPNDLKKKSKIIKIANDYTREEDIERRLIESNKLKYTGSFTRGVNVGNTQDVVLQSDFNIQMEGDLGNGLSVRAAISDDNIPIQPQGNTQVLQEFDKVFIELTKDRTSIIAGDYELGRPESYFMNYYKKLQGISISNESNIKDDWTLSNRGSFAISRGQFRRLELETNEGNQGPYKLLGESNELFLQVLSGTEKVYADGRLLKRGENFDYVIDYNRAELRFTPQVIITTNLRIIVEYEYATQEYLRSLYATESTFSNGKLDFHFNFYNEQDSKNTTGDIVLDSTDLALLSEIGDSPAFRSGIFIPEDNNFDGLIKYSFENNILTYAPDLPDDSPFARAANFSIVEGDLAAYEIDLTAGANGRVYTYVGPGLGSFGPWLPLIAPEKKQLITAGVNYKLSDSTNFFLETGISNRDVNRFSTVDSEDDTGTSFYASLSDLRPIFRNKDKSNPSSDTSSVNSFLNEGWTLGTEISLERISQDFQELNPYRFAEFTRDWNIENITETGIETLYNVGAEIRNSKMSLSYNLNGFNSRDIYDGVKNLVNYKLYDKGWTVDATFNLLNYESVLNNGDFFRPKALISKGLFGKVEVGFYYEKEKNRRRDAVTDSLQNISFNYDSYKAFITSNESNPFHINAAYTRRNDDGVSANQLIAVTTSDDYSLGGGWRLKESSDLTWQFTFRDFDNLGTVDNREASKRSLIGTINHRLALWNRGLQVETYAESNSGQEPKLEFQFIEVQRGEGSFVWNDYNMDSLQQINEFEIAPLSDLAGFERISVFNNEFISTNKIVFNSVLRLNPKRIWKEKKKFINRFQSTVRFQFDQRILSEDDESLLPRLRSNLLDTNLISFNSTTDASLFFDRGNVKRDFQITYRQISNKIQQITGYEVRSLSEIFTKSRLNIIKPLDFVLETRLGERVSDSELFEIQRFTIDFWEVEPQLNFRPSPKLRLITSYNLGRSTNQIGDMETSNTRDLGLELTWRKSSTSNLQVSFDWVDIEYNGSRNTPVEFEILQGLRPGSNFLWLVNYTRRLSKNFDLIINYNGRKSQDTRVINTAGVQLRAIF